MVKRLIYPASRAVEHAVEVAGVHPLRLFPVLWPLWRVHTTAEVDEEQQYDVIDHFIVLAIAQGGIDSRAELVRFLGLPPDLTGRCLRFLEMIGHVTVHGDKLSLDELGTRSLAAGIRYVSKESRQTLFIERYTGQPLARAYYHASVQVLSTTDVPEKMLGDRSQFLPVYLPTNYRPEVVEWLEQHPDRALFNLPSQLRQLRQLGVGDGYLPMYVVETVQHGLLVYSGLTEDRDSFFESVCQQVAVADLIEAQPVRDPREVWTAWLARNSSSGPGILRQLDNGIWRMAFSPTAFGPAKMPHTRIGTYQIQKHHLLQIWSDDLGTRQVAAKERALGIATLPEVQDQAQLRQRIERVARALDVTPPSIDELRKQAVQTGDSRRLAHLDLLTA